MEKNFTFNFPRMIDLRHERGWTQEELADRVQLSRPYIVNIEAGKRPPGRDAAKRIADAFDISLDDLFCSSKTPFHVETLERPAKPPSLNDSPTSSRSENVNWQNVVSQLMAHLAAQDEVARMRAEAEKQREENSARRLENERYYMEQVEHPKALAEADTIHQLNQLVDVLRGGLSHDTSSQDEAEQVRGA